MYYLYNSESEAETEYFIYPLGEIVSLQLQIVNIEEQKQNIYKRSIYINKKSIYKEHIQFIQ